MEISINTVLNPETHKLEVIITSKDVGSRFPTLWTNKDNDYYEAIYSDAYYDDRLRKRYEKNNMLSINGKERIYEIGIIYSDIDINNKKIVSRKKLIIKNIR